MADVEHNSIYGPVDSWRLGRSLGVDVLCVDSICSFECVYCQLGKINRVTTDRDVFVPTEKVISDLRNAYWQSADVITLSGSGEPTLAANLGEIITAIRDLTGKPIAILTNSTLLGDTNVRAEAGLADRVYCKLDAWSEDSLRRVDRPAAGVSLGSIVSGIRQFRKEYKGFLGIQTMLLTRPADTDIEQLAELYREIGPDEIELNIPLRPIPSEWVLESRGNVTGRPEGMHVLKTMEPSEAGEIGSRIAGLTGIRVITPFDRPGTE